jgi:uncharacterized membrane protein
MNKDTSLNIVRVVLMAIGGGLVAKGTTDANTLEQAVGGVLGLVGAAWQHFAHKKALATPVPEAAKPVEPAK